MNRFIIFIILLLSLKTVVVASPTLKARTGILIDYHSNEILFELDPDAIIYPASMTKIMTTIVAFDLLKKNKISLDDKFNISENAWRLSQAGYSSMFIMINDQVSVENLLKQRIIKEFSYYDNKKLKIIKKTSKEYEVLSGPYKSINLLKNDYIGFKNFGFEELNIFINE